MSKSTVRRSRRHLTSATASPRAVVATRPANDWRGLDETSRVIVYSITGAYVLAGIALSLALSRPPLVGLQLYAVQLLVAAALYPLVRVIGIRLSPGLRQLRAPDAYRESLAIVRRDLLRPTWVRDFLLIGLVIAVVLASFTSWKLAIPRVAGFGWDETLARWDRALHLGRHPWEWLHPVLGWPWVTRALDVVYFSLWFPAVLGIFTWQTWRPAGRLRTRFVVTFLATIIVVGTVTANLFASAGPQFYERIVGGPDPYAPLVAYLESVARDGALITTRIRDWLWAVHETGSVAGGAGISAMPSVHVALAELCAIAGRSAGRMLGATTTAFSLLTLVGSIHLGPHYAIDGYASVVLVHVLWRVTGRLCAPAPIAHASAARGRVA